MDDRMVAIEEKLAHLERYLLDLDAVVRGVCDEVGRLQIELARLRDARAPGTTPAEPQEGALEYEVPPHY